MQKKRNLVFDVVIAITIFVAIYYAGLVVLDSNTHLVEMWFSMPV